VEGQQSAGSKSRRETGNDSVQPLLRPSLSFWIAEEAVRATVQASSMLPHPFWLEGFPITWAAEKTREALGRTDITKE
jgi:hypothetical protein